MAVGDEQRLITPISQRQFELYALSLERGPNFDPAQIFGSYQAGHGSASGCILLDPGARDLHRPGLAQACRSSLGPRR
jgi:hypothetical protein